MTEKIAIDLGSVQKTLFLPVWGRAMESKKEHPLLVDKTALEIIERVDFDFSTVARNIQTLSQYAWIMRSLIVDRAIEAYTRQYPDATIVNIGCGMDTTFERVDNGRLTWYDLDLPDVIRLREQFIPESERRKFMATSFLETGWLEEIRPAEHILFIAAGVFYYFEAQEIREFLTRLADSFPGSQIVFDVSSPYGVKVANRMVIRNAGLDEKSFLKWGLDRKETLAAWDPRFRILATYMYYKDPGESLSLVNRLLGAFSDLMQIQYMLHLELGEA